MYCYVRGKVILSRIAFKANIAESLSRPAGVIPVLREQNLQASMADCPGRAGLTRLLQTVSFSNAYPGCARIQTYRLLLHLRVELPSFTLLKTTVERG